MFSSQERQARRIANRQSPKSRSEALLRLEKQLEESRLVKEDAFYRPPRTESEKKWLRQNRSKRRGALEAADGYEAGTPAVRVPMTDLPIPGMSFWPSSIND